MEISRVCCTPTKSRRCVSSRLAPESHGCLKRATLSGFAVLALAGCGGSAQLSSKALAQQAATLQSLAAEGGLAAGDAARGRATVTFTRIHARELRDAAGSAATALGGARPAPAIADKATKAARLARLIHADLDALSRSGSDRARQRELAKRLDAEAKQAEQLAS